MFGGAINRLLGRVTPEKMRVAYIAARAMWSCCGSCEHSVKYKSHCEPQPEKAECVACLNEMYKKVYGDKK